MQEIATQTLGFIGLGSQGAPMARRMMAAGYDLVLWARRPQSLEPFANSAAQYAEDINALAQQVDYCGLCVVDDDDVREICEQLIPAMRPGTCIVVHSTVTPALCQELAGTAQARGVTLLDAPVSGGGTAAAAGTLTVMLGGDDAAVERVRPILQAFSNDIIHLGAVGSGQQAKLVNNNLMAANLALAHHALQLADALGMAREEFIRLVQGSSGRSFAFEVCARMTTPAEFQHGANLLAKDVRLLGESSNDHVSYATLRDVANGFLQLALHHEA